MMSKKEQIEALNERVKDLEGALAYKDKQIDDYIKNQNELIDISLKEASEKRRFESECKIMQKFFDENPDIQEQYKTWKDKRKKDQIEELHQFFKELWSILDKNVTKGES